MCIQINFNQLLFLIGHNYIFLICINLIILPILLLFGKMSINNPFNVFFVPRKFLDIGIILQIYNINGYVKFSI